MEKVRKTVCEQNGGVSKEVESLKRKKKEMLELKSKITEKETH